MVSINEKYQIILDMVEKSLETQKKKIPVMYRGIYKSVLNSLKMLLAFTPVEYVEEYFKQFDAVVSEMKKDYESKETFKQVLEDIVNEWK